MDLSKFKKVKRIFTGNAMCPYNLPNGRKLMGELHGCIRCFMKLHDDLQDFDCSGIDCNRNNDIRPIEYEIYEDVEALFSQPIVKRVIRD